MTLSRLGIGDLAGRRPGELSGGEQQRVAIARALVSRPAVLFADEPTGALDSTSSRQVLALLRELVDEFGQTVVMVTHDPVAASYAGTAVFLADGAVVDQVTRPTVEVVANRMTHSGRPRRGSARTLDGHSRWPMITIALASVRHRRTAFVAVFLSIFLGAAILMAFSSMLDTAGQLRVGDADKTALDHHRLGRRWLGSDHCRVGRRHDAGRGRSPAGQGVRLAAQRRRIAEPGGSSHPGRGAAGRGLGRAAGHSGRLRCRLRAAAHPAAH